MTTEKSKIESIMNSDEFPSGIFLGDVVKAMERRSLLALGANFSVKPYAFAILNDTGVFLYPQRDVSDEKQMEWLCRRGAHVNLDVVLAMQCLNLFLGACVVAIGNTHRNHIFVSGAKVKNRACDDLTKRIHVGTIMVGNEDLTTMRIKAVQLMKSIVREE